MSISERKTKEKEEIKNKVLEIAIKLYKKEGLEGVSIRKIADLIDYSPASIYNHFKDKDDIFYQLHFKGFTILTEMFMTIQDNDPAVMLKNAGLKYLEFGLKYPEYYQIMFMSEAPYKKILAECKDNPTDDSFVFTQNLIEECNKAGALKIKNSESAAFAFWSLCHGMVSLMITRKKFILKKDETPMELMSKALEEFNNNLFK